MGGVVISSRSRARENIYRGTGVFRPLGKRTHLPIYIQRRPTRHHQTPQNMTSKWTPNMDPFWGLFMDLFMDPFWGLEMDLFSDLFSDLIWCLI